LKLRLTFLWMRRPGRALPLHFHSKTSILQTPEAPRLFPLQPADSSVLQSH
jgi:hypothetical protein